MKNIAKCKICQTVIESFHQSDYVMCQCGEIAVDGGLAMKCLAKNWENFLRIDEDGNEIKVKNQEYVKTELNNEIEINETKRETLIKNIKETIYQMEQLPTHALQAPLTHYDYISLLQVFISLLSSKD